MKSNRYSCHPACLLFPRLGDAELRALAEDIKANGLLHDIILYEGKILDGRNRYLACPLAGVEPRFKEWDGEGSPLQWVISENLVRRHMTSSQRAVVAHDLLPMLEREAKERQRLGMGRGKRVGKPLPTLSSNGSNGKLTVPEARELARSPSSIRRKVLGVVNNGGLKKKVARLVREAIIAARKTAARRYADANGARGNNQNILHGDLGLLRKRLDDESVRMFLASGQFAVVLGPFETRLPGDDRQR
jgi:hypothetical protein